MTSPDLSPSRKRNDGSLSRITEKLPQFKKRSLCGRKSRITEKLPQTQKGGARFFDNRRQEGHSLYIYIYYAHVLINTCARRNKIELSLVYIT